MNTEELKKIQNHLQEQLSALENYQFEVHEAACPDPNEFASNVTDAQVKMAMQARTTSAIRDIQDTLKKMQYAGYGYCDECGEAIAPARLRAFPTASTCVECQEALEKAI